MAPRETSELVDLVGIYVPKAFAAQMLADMKRSRAARDNLVVRDIFAALSAEADRRYRNRQPHETGYERPLPHRNGEPT